MKLPDTFVSIADVCDVSLVTSPGGKTRAPDLLFELPHGATSGRQFDNIRARLCGDLPEDLRLFFYVNTDVGAPELAEQTAKRLANPSDHSSDGRPRSVLIVRSLLPRTFVDCNRRLEGDEPRGDLTLAIPEYVRDDEDIATLRALHRSYQDVAERAYEWVCGRGGLAVMLHTYAPKSVQIDRVDDGIVAALQRAYEPDRYESWPDRPEIDVIGEAVDGVPLAPAGLVTALRERFAQIGIDVTESVTYKLHPTTTAYHHSVAYPGRAICIEFSRALLADPFTPFEEMSIGPSKVASLAAPLAAAILDHH
ncbi:MAG: N-formylglutamate amidohydrolase [Acidobacteriota bacterium]|nr:MAG: N-formylglutamate amidohydrolase [Acidobacteriota bacterium]